jgi:hypothetical protein
MGRQPQHRRTPVTEKNAIGLDLTAADLAPMWDGHEGRWLPAVWVATWLEG